MEKSLNLRTVNFFLLILIFFTSSFDIVLNLKIGGFSFRFSYLLMGLLFFLNSFKVLIGNFQIKFLGLIYFLIWSLFLVFFADNTTLLTRNIGYLLWHFIHFLLIIFIAELTTSEKYFNRLFKWYILSFLFLASIGLFQFVLGIFGVEFYTEQWWIPGRFPRVNGFAYEPSYYATYMLIGWTILFSLLINDVYIFSKKKLYLFLFLLTGSIVLSTSRMGIFFIVLVSSLYFGRTFVKSLLSLKVRLWQFSFLIFFAIIAAFSVFILIPVILTKYQFLLSGTGLQGQSAHSTGRFDIMKTLLEIFWSHPFSGTSLGGIPSALGAHHGVEVHTVEQAKEFEGINVFFEVLVASGIVGFTFFMLYLVNLFKASLKIKERLKSLNKESFGILSALVLALLVELLILCFNQTILRLYLWVHIAMLNSAYFVYKNTLTRNSTP